MGSWVIDSEVFSCVFLLGFIQGSDSKDVTKQQDPYEGLGIRVIIVYLCLFSFNGGKLTFTNSLCKHALNGPVM